MKHSLGPWRIETLNGKWPIVRQVPNLEGEAPSFIATVSCTRNGHGTIMARVDFGYGYKKEEMEANTKLIVSAPDLLEALRAIEDHHGETGEWRDIARAAIAKAQD